jgi:hypothetical protein
VRGRSTVVVDIVAIMQLIRRPQDSRFPNLPGIEAIEATPPPQ